MGRLHAEGKLELEALVNRRLLLAELQDALDGLRAGAAVRQLVVFTPGPTSLSLTDLSR